MLNRICLGTTGVARTRGVVIYWYVYEICLAPVAPVAPESKQRSLGSRTSSRFHHEVLYMRWVCVLDYVQCQSIADIALKSAASSGVSYM